LTNPSPESPWYTAEQAAKYLNTNAKTVRKLWALGRMRYVKPDIGSMKTKKEWMDEYMNGCEVKGSVQFNTAVDKIIREVMYA